MVGFKNISKDQKRKMGGGFLKKNRPLYLFVQ
jgi:hypothetical protein